MRLILLAHGLVNKSGHHYMEARSFKEEAGKYGLDCTILAHRDILPSIREELHALALFRYTPYAQPSTKWYRGVCINFWRLGRSMGKQLQSLSDEEITAADVFVSTLTTANELIGLTLWLAQRPRSQRPRLVLNFMIDNISRPVPGTNRWKIRKMAALFYYCAFSLLRRQIPPERLLLSASGDLFSRTMAEILQYPVAVFPLPVQHKLQTAPHVRRPTGQAPLIVILGMMRKQKGAQLVGPIVRGILEHNTSCRFLLQANPPYWEHIWQEEIGPTDAGRVLLHSGEMGQEEYHAWLQRADLVLLPYSPAHYILQTSGIFSEAMALGKPCIVPEGTWLADMARLHSRGVTIFNNHSAASIVDVTLQALNNLPSLTAAMETSSLQWRKTMGMQAFMQRLLERIPKGEVTLQ